MRALQDEIRQAQRELSCPVCNRTFELKDIRLRTFDNDAAAELSVICNRGHFPVILLVPITLEEVGEVGPITVSEARKASRRIEAVSDSFVRLFK